MSWLSDAFSNSYVNLLGGQSGIFGLKSYDVARNLGLNDVADFLESEVNKSDLRGAQAEALMSGVPGVGDILRGVEGVNQLEDLYNNTGKVPEYPAQQNLGISSLARVPEALTRKIEPGSNDLAEFYSGDRDVNSIFDKINSTEFKSSVPYYTTKKGETGWIKVI